MLEDDVLDSEFESVWGAVVLDTSDAAVDELSVSCLSTELAARAAAAAARSGAGRKRPWRGSVVSAASGSWVNRMSSGRLEPFLGLPELILGEAACDS